VRYWRAIIPGANAEAVSGLIMLVIDDGTRSQSYCLLLISETAIARDALLQAAEKYEVNEQVSNLLEYLDTEGESRPGRLPRWDEFRELADEYGVTV
jgi:hypothetical protein